ncbi:alanine aminotransferase 1 [Sarcoptes scabiei]|nr:alanine aminotransferase 1 [Sarcoptes scabiei]
MNWLGKKSSTIIVAMLMIIHFDVSFTQELNESPPTATESTLTTTESLPTTTESSTTTTESPTENTDLFREQPSSYNEEDYYEVLYNDYRKCLKDFAQFRHGRHFRFCNPPPRPKLPKEFDLRKLKVIPPVRNQKRCNASWAFGPLGAVESALIHRFHLPHRHFQLSTQELVDCAGNQGCRGGVDVTQAFSYLMEKGVVTEFEYPYTAKRGKCQEKKFRKYYHVKIKDYCAICPHTVPILKSFIYYYRRPLTTILHIRNRRAYNRLGIYAVDEDFGNKVRQQQVVNIVGWGYHHRGNISYWIVKNSMGLHWGHKGYAFVDIDSDAFEIRKNNFYVRLGRPEF